MASGYVKGRKYNGMKYSFKDEDFQEEDVWGLMEDLGGGSVSKQRNSKPFSSSSSSSSRHFPSTPRMIPRKEIMNPSKEYSKRSSAPVSIPNRQMIAHGSGSSWFVDGYGNGGGGVLAVDGDDDEDDGENEIVPPHEYIARRLARTQISSFSVCEGVGRKLKGRDLSQVRNDVLRKTGFLER